MSNFFLTEESLSHIYKVFNENEPKQFKLVGYISAFKDDLSLKVNLKATDKLKSDIHKYFPLGDYGYFSVTGGYVYEKDGKMEEVPVPEKSFCIVSKPLDFNDKEGKKQIKDFKDKMIELCNKYNQSGVLIKTKFKQIQEYNSKGDVTRSFNSLSFSNFEGGFSQLKTKKYSFKNENLIKMIDQFIQESFVELF